MRAVPELPEAGLPRGLAAVAVAHGESVGYVLAVDEAEPREPLVVERHALGHAAVALAIETLRRRTAAEAEARARGDFLWELAAGAITAPGEIAAKAVLLGYEVGRRYRVLVAEAEPGGEEALDELVRRIHRHARDGLHASRRGERVLALVPVDAPRAVAAAAVGDQLALDSRMS